MQKKKKAFLKFKMGEIPNRKSQGKPFNGEGASIEREMKNGQKIVQITCGTEKWERCQAAESVWRINMT